MRSVLHAVRDARFLQVVLALVCFLLPLGLIPLAQSDKGQTLRWERVDGWPGDRVVQQVVVGHGSEGKRLYAVARAGGLYVSPDGGKTWSRAAIRSQDPLGTMRVANLAANPSDPQELHLLLAFPSRNPRPVLYRTQDGGGTWSVRGDLGPRRVGAVAYGPDGEELYMTAGGNLFWEVEGEFREPSDWRRSGTTVPPRTLFDALSHVTTLLITGGRPATSDAAWSQARSLIYVGTASRGLHIVANRGSGELEVLRGEQDGVSVYVRERATIRSLANHPSRPGVLCVGTNRGLYASTDAGQSWFRLGQALRFEEVLSLLFDPQRGAIYVGLAAGGVWYTVDNGANWQPLADGLGRSAVLSLALDSGDSGTLYAGTDSGLWRLSLSPDGLEG